MVLRLTRALISLGLLHCVQLLIKLDRLPFLFNSLSDPDHDDDDFRKALIFEGGSRCYSCHTWNILALFWTNPSYPPNSFSLCPIPQCWVLPYNVSLIGQSRISDRRSRRRACTQQPRAPHPQFFKAPQISPLSYPSCFIFRVLVSLVLLTLLLPHLLEDAESTCACEIIDLQNQKKTFRRIRTIISRNTSNFDTWRLVHSNESPDAARCYKMLPRSLLSKQGQHFQQGFHRQNFRPRKLLSIFFSQKTLAAKRYHGIVTEWWGLLLEDNPDVLGRGGAVLEWSSG